MNNPGNVPPIRDVRYVAWDESDPSIKQIVKLQALLREEGVDPAELFGEGFTSVDHLSRWSAHWGIRFLSDAQDARYLHAHRERIERESQENREAALKSMIADYFRRQAHG